MHDDMTTILRCLHNIHACLDHLSTPHPETFAADAMRDLAHDLRSLERKYTVIAGRSRALWEESAR